MQTTETMTTAETTARTILSCPEWCTLPTLEHVPEFSDAGELLVWHCTVSTFGLIDVSATTRNGVLDGALQAALEDVVLTVGELRRLATDALAAAAWLEARP